MNHLLTVADAVATHARLNPDKLGARDSKRALSFSAWHERSTRLADGLLALGLAGLAFLQSLEADRQREVADVQRTEADSQRLLAQKNEAEGLVSLQIRSPLPL